MTPVQMFLLLHDVFAIYAALSKRILHCAYLAFSLLQRGQGQAKGRQEDRRPRRQNHHRLNRP